MKRFLITGSNGQLGKALTASLNTIYSPANVVLSDISTPPTKTPNKFLKLDVTHTGKFEQIVKNNQITSIVHLASILSATGELNPIKTRKINNTGLENALDIGHKYKCQVFSASSIASFGDKIPRNIPNEDTLQLPSTMYGVNKVYMERLGEYYFKKFGVDFRCVRYPVIVSSEEYGYKGTAIYSTEMFFKALKEKYYKCYLKADTYLPMAFIDDTVDCLVKLLDAPREKLTRCVYNCSCMSFCPGELAEEIKKEIPEFKVEYEPDFRQAIADTWPKSLNGESNKEFGYQCIMNVASLAKKIFGDIKEREKNKK